MNFKVRTVGANLGRAKRIQEFLLNKYEAGDCEAGVVDLVTDIRHYVRAMKFDFDHILESSSSHFTDEISGRCEECKARFDPMDFEEGSEDEVCPECRKKKKGGDAS